jgi:hypothetical protein
MDLAPHPASLNQLFGGLLAAAAMIGGLPALAVAATPGIVNLSRSTVTVNGTSVTTGFAVRTNGRYMGLVTSLRDGANVGLQYGVVGLKNSEPAGAEWSAVRERIGFRSRPGGRDRALLACLDTEKRSRS